MRFFVSSYAASPCSSGWDAAKEGQFFEGLAGLPFLRGLEIPFYGKLHRYDEEFFLSHLSPSWDYVITCLPGTMDCLSSDRNFGLASSDDAGRRRAMDFLAQALDAVKRLNDRAGRRAVQLVAAPSAPRGGALGPGTDRARLADSLAEATSWNWEGAALAIEHCDAFTKAHSPEKGFLSLDDEMQAIEDAGGRARIMLNWARSAIEGRSAELPRTHIRAAQRRGLLKSLFFSGCTADDDLYGAWNDRHAPMSRALMSEGPAGSLLGPEEVRASLEALRPGSVDIVGIKFQILPAESSVMRRLVALRQGLEAISGAVAAEGLSLSEAGYDF